MRLKIDLGNLLCQKIAGRDPEYWPVIFSIGRIRFNQRMKKNNIPIPGFHVGKKTERHGIFGSLQSFPLKHRRKKTAKNLLTHHKVYLIADW